jgi:hypothetical protein
MIEECRYLRKKKKNRRRPQSRAAAELLNTADNHPHDDYQSHDSQRPHAERHHTTTNLQDFVD